MENSDTKSRDWRIWQLSHGTKTQSCSLYSFFWVTPRRLNIMCRRFGTFCSIFIGSVSRKNDWDARKDTTFRTRQIKNNPTLSTVHCRVRKQMWETIKTTTKTIFVYYTDSRTQTVRHRQWNTYSGTQTVEHIQWNTDSGIHRMEHNYISPSSTVGVRALSPHPTPDTLKDHHTSCIAAL